jgi:hypothetical protein
MDGQYVKKKNETALRSLLDTHNPQELVAFISSYVVQRFGSNLAQIIAEHIETKVKEK